MSIGKIVTGTGVIGIGVDGGVIWRSIHVHVHVHVHIILLLLITTTSNIGIFGTHVGSCVGASGSCRAQAGERAKL